LDPVSYSSEIKRVGKVPFSIKVFQGIGAIPNSLKNFAFATFLLIYYDRVLGMPASWASGALFIAILIDAISDPLVGSWSDNFRSRLGRRHPFMFAGAIPLGLCLFGLFSPPEGLSDLMLFFWLLAFTVAARLSMTFFEVPWSALFAELSDDYAERSLIASYRLLVAIIGVVVFTVSVYTFVFPSTEAYAKGQLNPGNYPTFALVLAICVTAAALTSAWFTRKQVPYLLQPVADVEFSVKRSLHEVRLALANRDFRVLFLSVLFGSVLGGTNAAFEIYMRTYFWGLTSEGLRWFSVGSIGAVLILGLIPALQKRFDKKNLLVATLSLLVIDGMVLVLLRFSDVLPVNGDPLLLTLLVGNAVFRSSLAAVLIIMFISMMADLLDAQELSTGRRQEGVFMSAISFSGKATSGVGLLIVGLLLENVIGFSEGGSGLSAAALDPDTVFRLGLVDSVIVPIFYVIPVVMLQRGYKLTRTRHEKIQLELAELRSRDQQAASTQLPETG
jgi:GPH family glycoside/pentoside/hexuronide:cation symporter